MSIHRTISWLAISFCFCYTVVPVTAQETRGTIMGRVVDQSRAVIPGAAVHAVNVNTGVRTYATSNETGDYILPFLIPGTYTVTVELEGFNTFVRSGINVRVNDRITIDAVLEVGEATETVEVVADSPLLDTSTASIGQVIDSKTILELPLKDGMVLMMATMSPGVLSLGTSSGYVRPFDTSNPSNLSVGGERTRSNYFTVDGAPNMQRSDVAYSPPPGVVAEFKVQTSNFDASTGFMSGGTLNMSLKSGSNELHGQLYYFGQNPATQANQFFFNRDGLEKPNFRIHRWGGSSGGPLRLGGLYDGRDRTFWMYGYEGMWSFDPSPFFVDAVPTEAMRRGDFSELLALGPEYQIYDPYSARRTADGRIVRTPLPNNIIPEDQINPVSRMIASLSELPNQAGTADGVNNWQKGKNAQDSYYNHTLRLDHVISDRQRLSGHGYLTLMDRPENERHNRAVGDRFRRWNRGLSVDHVYTVSPSFIVDTRYSFTRFISGFDPFQMDWDLADLGFDPDFIRQVEQVDGRALRLPNVQLPGYADLSIEALRRQHSNIHDVAVNFTTLIRSHMLRYGIGYRVYQENNFNLGDSAGSFTFGTNWTRGPFDTSGSAPIGQDFAAFLYGLPTSGFFPINDSYAEQTTVLPLFIQDDWKISSKLTLSLGLRYERHSPLTERFDRTVRGFDPDARSPIEEVVRANYAASPLPELPPDQFQVKGGLTFAGVDGQPRALWKTNHNVMPRIGVAYSLTPKTVLRAGYGIYYAPIGTVYAHVDQTGFDRSTDFVASRDNGLSFVATLDNPFPDGFLEPLQADGGLATNLGQSVSYFSENLANPRSHRWQFAVQQELPATSVVEVSYVGNRGTRQRIGRELNPIPREYLSTSPTRDQEAIDFLNERFPNPFYPLLPGTALAGETITRTQLLRPFPQFTSVEADVNDGYSWYHSLQTRFEKRFSQGFSSSVSYTWSKSMEARQFLNDTDSGPYEVISDQDRTHRLVWNWIYELPFGRERRFGTNWSGVVNTLFGDWQLQGIFSMQSGIPLGFGNAIFTGDLNDVPLPSDERTVERWFNVDAGFERDSRRQLGSNIRTFPLRFNGIRSDIQNNWDLSLIKNAQLTEGVRLQFRVETINALNHPQMWTPNTNPTSSAFGQVSREWSWPRLFQFGAKILF
ncbi:MAG: hypothetical protein GEV06_17905 [Luteitalea sp.]|nr:hypothetical protein [Luteitalea sp.]